MDFLRKRSSSLSPIVARSPIGMQMSSVAHVEPGAREKALLAKDPTLDRFKSYKKSVAHLKRIGEALTVVVVAECCYEIYVRATMREEARKKAMESA